MAMRIIRKTNMRKTKREARETKPFQKHLLQQISLRRELLCFCFVCLFVSLSVFSSAEAGAVEPDQLRRSLEGGSEEAIDNALSNLKDKGEDTAAGQSTTTMSHAHAITRQSALTEDVKAKTEQVNKAEAAYKQCMKCESQPCDCVALEHNFSNAKDSLEASKRHLATVQNIATKKSGSNSTVEVLEEKENDMKVLGYFGAAATMYLGYEAVAACSNPEPSSKWLCPGLVVATGLASWQTIEIFKGGKEAKKQRCELTGENNCTPVDPEPIRINTPDTHGLELECPLKPDCPDTEATVAPSPDPNTSNTPSTPDNGTDWEGPDHRTGNPCIGSQCDETDDDKLPPPKPDSTLQGMPPNVAPQLEPPGGWPGGKNPFDEHTNLNPKKIPPKVKKQIDKMMNQFKKKHQAYLDKNLSGGGANGEGEGGDSTLVESPSTTGAFTGGEVAQAGGGAAPDGSLDQVGSKGRDKSGLAGQIKKMMDSIYGKGGSGKDPHAGKSTTLGSEKVGVMEDNIFLMAHRRHRALDQNDHFITSGF